MSISLCSTFNLFDKPIFILGIKWLRFPAPVNGSNPILFKAGQTPSGKLEFITLVFILEILTASINL